MLACLLLACLLPLAFPSWEGLGAYKGRFFTKGRVCTFIKYKFLKICIKIHNYFRDNSPHFPLFPIPDSRFPTPDSRLPTQM
ncbi:MAG: hypothetical protein F6J90_14870 [Moorea sp. SIOASIH]|uniref:hypothetical protein n=1 Tax=Moorena sp. SIOASIH TaxID=2607817 RepID=UPI0013B8B8FF|nr:hypothetical protein [Moorena sp. SIOASIH]NEO37538.1 hypothetical protein [Moorena sp. SIOASIH]